MKKTIIIMALLLISLPLSLADGNDTEVNISIATMQDARVGVDCRASGTCHYDINGESFERLDERWSRDTSGIGDEDVTEMFVESVGCLLGVDRFLGERSYCRGDNNRLVTALDRLFQHYMGFFVQRQEWSLYRQDKIMARQDMLMEALNQSFDPYEVEMRTARISYNRVGGPVRTESGYTCDVKDDRFVCIKEVEE